MKKKIIIFSSIFVVVTAAIVCLLVFLLPLRNNGGEQPTPDDPGTEQSDTINGVKYDEYTNENLAYTRGTIEETFDMSPEALFPGAISSWKKVYYKSSLNGFVSAFQKANIDIEKFKNFTLFIKNFPDLIGSINFNLDSILNAEEITGAQLFELISKSENINGVYKILVAFQNTGLTDEDIANVLYYYIENEMSLLNTHKIDLYASLTEIYKTNAMDAFVRSTLYDILPELYTTVINMGKDNFVVVMEELIGNIKKALAIYKDYNFYALVDMLNMIKEGDLKPEELAVMMHELETSIDDMIDPETGKVFNISNQFYSIYYSLISKVPFVLNIISSAANLPNMSDFIPYLANATKDVEEFLNRFMLGLKNVVSNINMEENVIVRDIDGNVTGKTSMAEALCTHLNRIATDDGYLTANSDTVILISKALSPMFRENGLTKEFMQERLFKNSSAMFSSILNMVKDFAPEQTEEMTTAEEFIEKYDLLLETFISSIDMLDYFAKFDMGTQESKLSDASPSYIILQTYLDTLLNAIVTGDIATFSELSLLVSTVVAVPVIVTMTPIIIVSTVIGAPVVGVYSMITFASVYAKDDDSEMKFSTALGHMLEAMIGKIKDQDGEEIQTNDKYIELGQQIREKITSLDLVDMIINGNFFVNTVNKVDSVISEILSKVFYNVSSYDNYNED